MKYLSAKELEEKEISNKRIIIDNIKTHQKRICRKTMRALEEYIKEPDAKNTYTMTFESYV